MTAGVILQRFALTLAFALLATANASFAGTDVPFHYRDGMIWVDVSAAGVPAPLHFLLDSGAGRSVLDLTTARRSGFLLGSPQAVLGAGGRGVAYSVNGFDGKLEAIRLPSSLLAIDLSKPGAGCHCRIDGLLGADFFREHLVRIDYTAQRAWIGARDEYATGEAVPLVVRNDALCASVSVNGNPAQWMRLDTGCNTSLEWVTTVRRQEKPAATTIGLTTSLQRRTQTEVRLGSIVMDSVNTGVHYTALFPGEAGLIGNGVLSKFKVTIDASHWRCFLERL